MSHSQPIERSRKMKRISIFLFLLLMFFLASCTPSDISADKKILPPDNKDIPIEGTWKVEKYKKGASKNSASYKAEDMIGKAAVFDDKVAVVGDESCIKPLYKVKNVDASDYLLYQYKTNASYLGITSPSIQVITVTAKDQFFYEFIKYSDTEIITYVNGTFLYFKKVSGKVNIDSSKLNEKGKNVLGSDRFSSGSEYSGILLGLKSHKKSSDAEYSYRTLWISSSNKISGNVYETEGLFVPRKSGFWTVNVKQNNTGGRITSRIIANSVGRNIYDSAAMDLYLHKTNAYKDILYVGNNYISTENTDVSGIIYYRMLPIDNIENIRAVKISDIAGNTGKAALFDSGKRYLTSLSENDDAGSIDEENFAVVRRNGHWVLKGKLSNSDKGDFYINTIPPKILVSYDELFVPWNVVKLKIPDAVDVYTSPNMDMAIILTNTNIYIYTIDNGTLSKMPIRKVKLNDKETAVMAEWATGKYTNKWQREFISQGAKVLKS